MKIITQRQIIRDLPDRWRATMQRIGDSYGSHDVRSRKETLAKLEALNLETATPEDIAQIIGNSSWTRLDACGECGDWDCKVLIRIGEEPDYDSATAYICPVCLQTLAETVKEVIRNP